MTLITQPHFEAADDFYEALIDAHRDLPADQSHALNARLVLPSMVIWLSSYR